jgi:hypothetical protein
MAASLLAFGMSLVVLAQPQGAPGAPPPTRPPAAQDAAETTLEGVVVKGRTKQEQYEAVSRFVRQMAEPAGRRLARWEQWVCPGIVGMTQRHGSYVLDRFAQEAWALGLQVGEPGCKPDFLIVVTTTPREVAAKFREDRVRFFAHQRRSGGKQKLSEFVEVDRPVRWWHVAEQQENAGSGGGRLASTWREQMSRALLIVDANQLEGITTEQLASYLAMASLAQLKADAQPAELQTIMTLFADRAAGKVSPATLTDWDRAYLNGLYRAPEDLRSVSAQRGEIARRLRRVGSGRP